MFDLNSASIPKSNKDRVHLPSGNYKCRVSAVRRSKTNFGVGFFFDCQVIEGEFIGSEVGVVSFPDNVTGRKKDGSFGIPKEDAVNAELGKIKASLAAAFGYPKEEMHVITNAIASACISGDHNNNQPSVLVGRTVGILSTHKNGKSYYSAFPWPDAEREDLREAVLASAPAPAPPPPSSPFPPPGWTLHPDAAGYYYRGTEVLSESDLRARSK